MVSKRGYNSESESKAAAVSFDDVHAGDCISIETISSKYQFLVVNASERMGILTGGMLGESAVDAMLAGALFEKEGTFYPPGLKAGCRAIFFIGNNEKVEKLTTSVIADIIHVKGYAYKGMSRMGYEK